MLAFETEFKSLGLEISTKDFQDGRVLVGHTASRKQELHDQLQVFLDANLVSPKEAERLRGRMIFFEGFTFGRMPIPQSKLLDACAVDSVARSRWTS